MHHYFIGLTFSSHLMECRKIDAFRAIFDSKYSFSSTLHVTLLPPFSIEGGKIDEMVEVLCDLLDSYLTNVEEASFMEFKSLDFRPGKKGVVFLRPTSSIELFHCQEAMCEALLDLGAQFKIKGQTKAVGPGMGPRPNFSPDFFELALPLARSSDPLNLKNAINRALNEYEFPLHLQIKDITLFEKLPGSWPERKKLFSFKNCSDSDIKNHFKV